MRFCGISLRHYSGESNLRLIVGVESLAVFLNRFVQMFAVDGPTGDACLSVSVLDDYFEFCTHTLLRYWVIALLNFRTI